jgi:hypothetical protein
MSTCHLRPAENSPFAHFVVLMEQAYAIVHDLDPEQAIAALGDVEKLRAGLWRRAVVLPGAAGSGDVLLTAEQTSSRLGIGLSALYRRKWPFRVEVSPGRTRYSSAGIERFIRSRLGR